MIARINVLCIGKDFFLKKKKRKRNFHLSIVINACISELLYLCNRQSSRHRKFIICVMILNILPVNRTAKEYVVCYFSVAPPNPTRKLLAFQRSFMSNCYTGSVSVVIKYFTLVQQIQMTLCKPQCSAQSDLFCCFIT